jgi:hypothetical protein
MSDDLRPMSTEPLPAESRQPRLSRYRLGVILVGAQQTGNEVERRCPILICHPMPRRTTRRLLSIISRRVPTDRADGATPTGTFVHVLSGRAIWPVILTDEPAQFRRTAARAEAVRIGLCPGRSRSRRGAMHAD